MHVTEELIEAFLNGNEEITYFMKKNSKEIILLESNISEQPEIDESNLVAIPYMTASEAYKVMLDFAKEQEAEVSERLIDALNRKKPFRSFKEQIRGHEVEQAWYDYENDYAKRIMSAWVEQSL